MSPRPSATDVREALRQLRSTMQHLSLEDWTRGATFTGTTPGWTQTVFDVACGLVKHEHAHFEQITAAALGSK